MYIYIYIAYIYIEHSFPSKNWQRLDDHRHSFHPGCPPAMPAMLAPRRRGGSQNKAYGSMMDMFMIRLWYSDSIIYSYDINTYMNWLYIYIWVINLNYKMVFLGLWKHWGCWGSWANPCFFSWDQHKIVSFCVQIYFIVVHLGFFPHVILDVSYIPSIIYYINIIYIYICISLFPHKSLENGYNLLESHMIPILPIDSPWYFHETRSSASSASKAKAQVRGLEWRCFSGKHMGKFPRNFQVN